MKKYVKIFAGILATAFIATGCNSYAQTGYNGAYNNPNYNSAYGDGQPGDNYYYDNNQQPNGQMPVGFNDFYNQLSPYGSWVNMAPYGPVWVANVPNFQPYSTNGYWNYTNYGWTWVSNYPWGWAPFHYGRWGYANNYGWYWVPGYVWGPAWVAWSSSADMYGWAPLMPGMNFGVSLSINLFPSSYWTFMPGRYMGMNNIGGYYVNRSRNVTIIKNTTIINNYGSENNRRYTMGPKVNDVQRYTSGRTIQQMRVTSASDSRSAGISNNEMRVYRPVSKPAGTNTSPNNRSTVAPQTRTAQPQQSGNRNVSPQTKPQQVQATPQTRSSQQPTQQEPVYQRNPAQPKVTNPVAPQTSRQIQAAQNENKRVQQQQQRSESQSQRSEQQRSSTPSRSSNGSSQPRR